MIPQIILFFATLYFIYSLLMPKRPDKFPPGPRAYPFVGSALSLKKYKEKVLGKTLMKLGEDFGPICGLFFGPRLAVIINGHESVKEVLSRDEFNGRIVFPTVDQSGKIVTNMWGIMFANGDRWREQRRFTIRSLRDSGFGKSSQEDLIYEEIGETQRMLRNRLEESVEKIGEPITFVHDMFSIPMINILLGVVSGKRFSHDDPQFLEIVNMINEAFRSGNQGGSLILDYPILRHLPYFSGKWAKLTRGRIATMKLLEEQIEEHKKTRVRGSPRDFMDQYLDEMQDLEEKGALKESYFSEYQLMCACNDLFMAGIESTSNSIAFAILYMVNYPEIQDKVQKEIDRVVGQDRLPSLTDRSKMPYTEAVMIELLRISNIAPLTVPHSTEKDASINGYCIPKDTFVMINLYSVHMDKEYWGDDAETFRPDRFLNAKGEILKNDRIIPFGMGKRICPGEVLARMNYFLFFTSFLQKFKFEAIPGCNPDQEPQDGFTIAPKPFKAKITNRF